MEVIAIDGASGVGKSTTAKEVAMALGYNYLDTGTLYRGIALYLLENKISLEDGAAIEKALKTIDLSVSYNDKAEQRLHLGSVDISGDIRTEGVSQAASKIAVFPVVRDYILDIERAVAKKYNLVADGRDIGTVVFPGASHKFFLTCPPEVKARRRHKENLALGQDSSYEAVLAEILLRDERDSSRAIAPLKKAHGAIEISTEGQGIAEVCAEILSHIEHRED